MGAVYAIHWKLKTRKLTGFVLLQSRRHFIPMLIETHPGLMEHRAIFQVIFILAKAMSVLQLSSLGNYHASFSSLALSDMDKVCFKDNGLSCQRKPV